MGSLSPPRLNIFTVGNMGVVICLGQGGLRSLSASSLSFDAKQGALSGLTHIDIQEKKVHTDLQVG